MRDATSTPRWGRLQPAAHFIPLILPFLLLLTLLAAPAQAGRLPTRVYRTRDGLPRNSVICMVPGLNGSMWFCTTEGLVRFDGVGFRTFGPEQGLPSRLVLGLQPSRAGGYWLITDRGICRLPADSKIGEPCRVLPGSAAGEWRLGGELVETSTGEVWAASVHHLYRVRTDAGVLTETAVALPNGIGTLAELPNGGLLLGTDAGLFERTRAGVLRRLGENLPPFGIADMLRVPSGDYWLATSRGLFRLRFNSAGQPEFQGGWLAGENANPRNLLLRQDGSLWANTTGAVLKFDLDAAGDAHLARRISYADGLPNALISTIAEDRTGGLWVATEGGGVARIEDNGFVLYDTADGLYAAARIAALFEDRAGRLCAMTSWDGQHDLHVWTGARFAAVPIPYPRECTNHSDGWKQIALQSRDGEWWIATGQGILRFAAAKTADLPHAKLKAWYRAADGLDGDHISRVFEDSTGAIWAGVSAPKGHIARFDPAAGRFHSFSEAEGWPTFGDAVAFSEAAGDLWIATWDSVLRYRAGRFELIPLGNVQRTLIRDLFADREGRLWVATAGQGLFRCDRPGADRPFFVAYTSRAGLSSMFVRAVIEDPAGYIYAASVRGVDRLDPRAPHDAARILHFTAADGLPDSENNVALATHDGRLWFGTLQGVAEMDPARIPHRPPPAAYLTRVLVRGEEVPLQWDGSANVSLSLAADRNQVQIEFSGSDSYRAPSLRYQYRLAGVDPQWSEPITLQRVNYPTLPAGRMQFEVRAVNAEGQVSKVPAVLQLEISAPLWRRPWFLLLAGACLAAAASFAYRYRVEHLLHIERLRVRIATDLHDDIGANLSQIALLSDMARRNPDRGSLEIVSTIARQTVEDMSDIVWAVNPRHDHFDALLHRMRRYAADTLGAAGIDLAFTAEHLPASLTTPIEVRRPLYLIFKEAVNNAARHSQARSVAVSIDAANTQLQMTISDDGRGFDPQAPREGEGLNSISRRSRELGGSATWKTAPGKGTTLAIILPLRQNPHLNW